MTDTEKEPTIVRLCYGIPYRRQERIVEFCLFVFPHQRDWDFPQTLAAEEGDMQTTKLLEPCAEAGVGGRVHEVPLGQFEASRGAVTEAITAFLVEVTEAEADDDEAANSASTLVPLGRSQAAHPPQAAAPPVGYRPKATQRRRPSAAGLPRFAPLSLPFAARPRIRAARGASSSRRSCLVQADG